MARFGVSNLIRSIYGLLHSSSARLTAKSMEATELIKGCPALLTTNYSRLAPRFSGIFLPYLPEEHVLPKSKKKVILDYLRSEGEKMELYAIMKGIVEDGQEYCPETMGEEDFQNYFLSHDTFVIKDSKLKEVLGGFYLKPNFCGRSSHVANTGFIVKREYRGTGIGEYMTRQALKIAKDIGYRSVMGNLVYANNRASLQLMKKIGFHVSDGLPKAGNMKGIGLVTAYQIYFDLKTLEK